MPRPNTRSALLTGALVLLFSPVSAESPEIVSIAEAHLGAVVTVQGAVERITDEDEFWLADDSGRILIYVGSEPVPAEVGETVIVSGRVDDDPDPREIYARTLTRADGTVITFDQTSE